MHSSLSASDAKTNGFQIGNSEMNLLRTHFVLLMFAMIVVPVGTGLYSLAPGIAYVAVLIACACLFLNHTFVRAPLRYIDQYMVAGFLIFNSFFLVHSLFFFLETRIYFVNLISLGMFLLVYTYGTLLLLDQRAGKSDYVGTFIALISIAALTILLLGQAAEVLGYLDRRELGFDDQDVSLMHRPGGFLNPNTTSAIALVFLFSVETLSRNKRAYLVVLALALTTVIVFLSQSRAAIIVLIAYLLFLTLKKGLVSFVVASTSLIILFWIAGAVYQLDIVELFEATVSRFGGDTSSEERYYVLNYGLSAFADAPTLGNGYRFLESAIGTSAHNEIIENLVNFGIVGAIVISMALYFLYWPASALLLFVCVLPTFMFSHNFFETTAFQAALGLALAIDRIRNKGASGYGAERKSPARSQS